MASQFDTMNPTATQLGWAVQRIASLAGQSVERLSLHQALLQLDAKTTPSEQIMALCEKLHWPRPIQLQGMDQARLPVLVFSAQSGWAAVLSRNAQGSWLMHSSSGACSLETGSNGELTNSACWHLTLPSAIQKSQRAWHMIRRTFLSHTSTWIEGMLATVLINFVALATSMFSMQVYDRVIPSQGYHTLLVLGLGVVLSILFELVLKYTRSRVMEYAVVNLDSSLSRDVFQRLLNIRLDQMPQSVGSLAGQLRAYEGIRALLTASTAYLLVDIPFALVFIVLMMMLGSSYVALVPLSFLAVSLITGLALRRGIHTAAQQGARAANEKTGLLVEVLEGAETIKSSHGNWRFLSRWIDLSHKTISYDLKIRHLSETGGFLTAAFQQLSYAGLIAVGAWQVMEGQMTMGTLIACSILSGRALSPAGMLPGLMVQYAHAKAALNGLEHIYALESDNAGIDRPLAPTQIQGNYKLEAVRYAYPGASPRLGNVHIALTISALHIYSGEKIAVVGAMGSGKSTLLRLLSGMYQPREGRILLDDLELSHIARQQLSEQVGYLQQEHRLFQGTLRDNLLIGLTDPGDDVLIEATRETGLVQLIREHPMGLDLPISEGGKGLSGGQRQLVALTRLVLAQPKVWLLDEPTSSMDGATEQLCIELLQRQLTEQHTLVLVTHKPALLALADRVIVMAKQQIILDGSKDSVLQTLVEKSRIK
jgi:ATP-binding cassette, subfamily C, bacterial LapB